MWILARQGPYSSPFLSDLPTKFECWVHAHSDSHSSDCDLVDKPNKRTKKRQCPNYGNGPSGQKPNFVVFSGLGSHYRMLLGQKLVEKDLLWSCRQPPAESRQFSGQLNNANPEFLDFGPEVIAFGI